MESFLTRVFGKGAAYSFLIVPFVEIFAFYGFICMGQSHVLEAYRYSPWAMAMIIVMWITYKNAAVSTKKQLIQFSSINSFIYLILDSLLTIPYPGLRKGIFFYTPEWFVFLFSIFSLYFVAHLSLFFIVYWIRRVRILQSGNKKTN